MLSEGLPAATVPSDGRVGLQTLQENRLNQDASPEVPHLRLGGHVRMSLRGVIKLPLSLQFYLTRIKGFLFDIPPPSSKLCFPPDLMLATQAPDLHHGRRYATGDNQAPNTLK